MFKKAFIITLFYLINARGFAQHADTSGYFNEHLSANAALVNGFPLPADVLKFETEIQLSPNQKIQLKQIIETLALKTAEVNSSSVRNERMLDSMFSTRRVNEGTIIFYTTVTACTRANTAGLFYWPVIIHANY